MVSSKREQPSWWQRGREGARYSKKLVPRALGPAPDYGVARRRLGTLALLIGLVLAVYLVVVYFAFPFSPVGFRSGLGVLAFEVGIWALCRSKAVPDKRVFHWALGAAIVAAWLGSVATHFGYEPRVERFTFALLSVFCLPFYAVLGRRRVILVAAAMAAAQPVVAFLSYGMGVARGSPRDLFGSVVGASLALVVSIGATELIQATRRETVRAVGGYELRRKLGSGGMGEVWEGRHRFLARPAAIKLLAGEGFTPDLMRRFEREAQATALLTSEHTVRLFDFGSTEDRRPYYVMELLQGSDLQTLIDENGALSPPHAVHLMCQVCDSVGEAHEAGVVHRDLKPSNLFLTRRGLVDEFVKVLDFGLVSVEGGMSLTHEKPGFIGTFAYSAPEVLFGQSHDQRSDVYQLGCVMFFLLTGRVVFEGNTMQSLLAHASGPAPRPSEFSPRPLPEDLEELVLRCLSKDPAERPSSAEALYLELRSLDCFGTWTDAKATEYVELLQLPLSEAQPPIADALRRVEARG